MAGLFQTCSCKCSGAAGSRVGCHASRQTRRELEGVVSFKKPHFFSLVEFQGFFIIISGYLIELRPEGGKSSHVVLTTFFLKKNDSWHALFFSISYCKVLSLILTCSVILTFFKTHSFSKRLTIFV